jgi:hypothetical protein
MNTCPRSIFSTLLDCDMTVYAFGSSAIGASVFEGCALTGSDVAGSGLAGPQPSRRKAIVNPQKQPLALWKFIA